MNTKDFRFKLADLNDSGTFEGIASVYGNKDSYGDVVEAGAFTKTLQERGDEVPLLWSHDITNPVGTGKVSDTSTGLAIKGTLDLDTQAGRDAYSRMRKGIAKGLSIGYSVLNDAWDSQRKVRRLLEVKLYEVSLVVFPANELATVTGVKGAEALAGLYEELKSGRTLSTATRKRIEMAITDLAALLSEADADDDEAAKSKAIEPELLHSMVLDWRNAR
jgi:uncharacterized protein